MMKHRNPSLATGALSAAFGLGHLSLSQAQDAPPVPPPADQGALPPPRPDEGPEAAQPADPQAAPVAVKTAPDADDPRPAAPPVSLEAVKARLAEALKGLSVGQGAEIMPREGFWRVPLIAGSRVVGELRVSGDGTKVIEEFGAARDTAIFAR